MQPPKAWLAADGVIEDVDTLKKTAHLAVKQLVFHDKEYKLPKPVTINMDMKVAVIYRDSVAMPLSAVRKGDEGTAVSYAEVMKKLVPSPIAKGEDVLKSFPSPTPVDEVYLKAKPGSKPKEQQQAAAQTKPLSTKYVLAVTLGILGIVLMFALLMPRLILQYYKLRYRKAAADKDKSYWAYRAVTYYLHMCGINRGTKTPMQFARKTVDPLFGTSFAGFMNIYLKKKYANQPLTVSEQTIVSGFLPPFLAAAGKKTGFKTRFLGFMNPLRCIGFYMVPEEDEKEN
jgi:hypothetical protein